MMKFKWLACIALLMLFVFYKHALAQLPIKPLTAQQQVDQLLDDAKKISYVIP